MIELLVLLLSGVIFIAVFVHLELANLEKKDSSQQLALAALQKYAKSQVRDLIVVLDHQTTVNQSLKDQMSKMYNLNLMLENRIVHLESLKINKKMVKKVTKKKAAKKKIAKR